MRFTEGRTFTASNSPSRRPAQRTPSAFSGSFLAVRDAPAAKIVRRQLHRHLVAGQDPDEVHPHLARDMRQHLVAVVELHPEHRVGQRLDDRPFHLNDVLLGHGVHRPPLSLPRVPSTPLGSAHPSPWRRCSDGPQSPCGSRREPTSGGYSSFSAWPPSASPRRRPGRNVPRRRQGPGSERRCLFPPTTSPTARASPRPSGHRPPVPS